MSDVVKIEVFFECNGTEESDVIEVPRAKWESMTEDERDEYMGPTIETIISNNISAGWNEIG